ncbi:DUF6249 domain-containing protein [Gammaproteobacteria bacterium]|nr:DUF6249 domain-containing protein [Gammaproteobacteria bacterium]
MDEIHLMMEQGTAYAAILMPVLITWVILYYGMRMEKDKYEAMVEIAKNLKDPSEIEDLLENFKENKKPIDYRRNGVIAMFIGLGLFVFGLVQIKFLIGVGLLIICIGFGSLVAGYIYPNAGSEIDKAVAKFEKN